MTRALFSFEEDEGGTATTMNWYETRRGVRVPINKAPLAYHNEHTPSVHHTHGGDLFISLRVSLSASTGLTSSGLISSSTGRSSKQLKQGDDPL
jgi:hypothetical protein